MQDKHLPGFSPIPPVSLNHYHINQLPVFSYPVLRSILFRFNAEFSHDLTLNCLAAANRLSPLLKLINRCCRVHDPRLHQKLAGLDFPNPVGLAAGLDKDARALRSFAALGFGFLECGTVTPLPQTGNPRPRLFRLPRSKSLQNAMGFNNLGMDAMWARLVNTPSVGIPLGINLGKNKTTTRERTLDDYLLMIKRLGSVCDYFVINVSSPNTPGLRDFQESQFVSELITRGSEQTEKTHLAQTGSGSG